MKAEKEKIVYNGVVITKLPNGKYIWLDNETTLEQCKKEIDDEYGGKSPLGSFFSV